MKAQCKPLRFLDGTLFASDYVRIVNGGRGSYIELEKEQIEVELVSKFGFLLPDEITPKPFYYYWLIPEDREEKIYWQIKTVSYADYKIGMFYIAPDLVSGWDKPKSLQIKEEFPPPLF